MARDWTLSELEQEVRKLISKNYSSFEQECLTASLDEVIEVAKYNDFNLRTILNASKYFMNQMPEDIAPISSLTHQRFLKSFQVDYACMRYNNFTLLIETFRTSQVKFGDDPEFINHLRSFSFLNKDLVHLSQMVFQYFIKMDDLPNQERKVDNGIIRSQLLKSLQRCTSIEVSEIILSYENHEHNDLFNNIFNFSQGSDQLFEDAIEVYNNYKGNEMVNQTLNFLQRNFSASLLHDYKKLLRKTKSDHELNELSELIMVFAPLKRSNSIRENTLKYLYQQPNLNGLSKDLIFDYFYNIYHGFKDEELADSMSLRDINKITSTFNLSCQRFHNLGDGERRVRMMFVNYLREVESIDGTVEQKKRYVLGWCDEIIKSIKRSEQEGLLYQNNLAVNK